MSKNFINYHVVISHNPSCLNRDDMNMQKTAVFGGSKRIRISSQSLKRTMRKSNYYYENISDSSVRSRILFSSDKQSLKEIFVESLKDRFDELTIIRTLELLTGKEYKPGEIIFTDSVAPWAVEEVAWFCEKIQAAGENFDETKFKKEIKNDIAALRMNLHNAVDIALSGRMATSGLLTEIGKIDGALSVAHAITTHTVENDLDWFTAVDDLQELGSGHLDTQEFSSGVFYRYASLNISQLQENLGGISREEVLKIAFHILHLITTETPSAKQQSFAAHNLADYAIVSISDQPISLANAFEAPIPNKGKGYLSPSIDAINDYLFRIHNKYSINEKIACFSLSDISIPTDFMIQKANINELKDWIRKDGE